MEETSTHKEIKALIRLLDETDPQLLETIESKLFSMRRDALPLLEEAANSIFNGHIQQRINLLLGRIQKERVRDELLSWIEEGARDLLKGYIIISRIAFPGLDELKLTVQIEQIRMDAWLEMNDELTALENIKVLNHILFKLHRFSGNKENPRIPDEQYLPSLLRLKKGTSLSLGILYLIIAQKLKLPLAGVNLPEHFILAYLGDRELPDPQLDDVLFYINPFKGSVFTRREIELFLRQLKIKSNLDYFAPCTNREVIIRLVKTLINYYGEQKNKVRMNELNELLTLLENE
ncbi:MAG: transglutaminase-like domain-containing protein [Syntrophothermus sp.]